MNDNTIGGGDDVIQEERRHRSRITYPRHCIFLGHLHPKKSFRQFQEILAAQRARGGRESSWFLGRSHGLRNVDRVGAGAARSGAQRANEGARGEPRAVRRTRQHIVNSQSAGYVSAISTKGTT